MSLSYNLMIAEQAVDYVGSIVKQGAENKPIDIVHSQMRGGDLVMGSVRNQRTRVGSHEEKAMYHDAAAIAKNTQKGNCAEQATIAFEYLSTKVRQSSLCLVTLGSDHVCVMIGPPDDYTAGSNHEESLMDPPANWASDAVVCDPWYHEWFGVNKDWTRGLYSILRVTHPSDAKLKTAKIHVIDQQSFA